MMIPLEFHLLLRKPKIPPDARRELACISEDQVKMLTRDAAQQDTSRQSAGEPIEDIGVTTLYFHDSASQAQGLITSQRQDFSQ